MTGATTAIDELAPSALLVLEKRFVHLRESVRRRSAGRDARVLSPDVDVL